MDKMYKELVEKRLAKVNRNKAISNSQKIEIFQNEINTLQAEINLFKKRLINIKTEQNILNQNIKKLSKKGWNKFQT